MKFEIRKSRTGKHFYFNLKADNNQVIVTSEMYESKQAAKKGIRIVKNSWFSATFDKTK